MKIASIVATSMYGTQREITAANNGSLWVDRDTPDALFIDIRDDGLPIVETDGKARIVATIPTSWAIQYHWRS